MSLPSVFDYLDYRAFLRDWFEARKREDTSYSYAMFARDGGGSKAALANVISNTRSPRSGTLDAFARAMALSPLERNYLGLLVEFDTAPDITTRRATMDKMLATERYGTVRQAESEPDSDVYRYLEHWYIPAIRELAGIPGFQDDAAWVACTLMPKIGEEEAAAALATLFELDLLGRRDDGTVFQKEIRFRTEPNAFQSAAAYFHREVIPQMLRQVDTRQSTEQHILAATVALDASLLPEVKARLTTFVNQLATLADESPVQEGKRVYQLAVQLLPLSGTVR